MLDSVKSNLVLQQLTLSGAEGEENQPATVLPSAESEKLCSLCATSLAELNQNLPF